MSDTANSGASQPAFDEMIKWADNLKKQYVNPQIEFYKKYTRWSRWFFRTAGVLTVVLSAMLPALAAANFCHQKLVLSVVSIAVAALTGLSAFFRWERMWRGYSTSQVALEQHVAKWELELANAKLLLSPEKRTQRVYDATNDLLTNAKAVVSLESEAFFSGLQFPLQDSSAKPNKP